MTSYLWKRLWILLITICIDALLPILCLLNYRKRKAFELFKTIIKPLELENILCIMIKK